MLIYIKKEGAFAFTRNVRVNKPKSNQKFFFSGSQPVDQKQKTPS